MLPLIKTGAKIIYTNNADPQLIAWLRANKLPYNINKSIGAVAERRGRDEVISLIGFDFGPEWTMGQLQPAGAGTIEPGQQYVAERITGQSAKFTEWLNNQEAKRQDDVKKQDLIAKIERLRQGKLMSKISVSRIKEILRRRKTEEYRHSRNRESSGIFRRPQGRRQTAFSEPDKGATTDVWKIEDIAIMPKRIALEHLDKTPICWKA